MIALPEAGLYRTTRAYPGHEQAVPAGVLVYVGVRERDGATFVVRPGENRKNRWYWGEPTTLIRSAAWGETLKRLPQEGFYTLPWEITIGETGRWLENAIVQLGYNGEGRGILFVGEDHEDEARNVLIFSTRGTLIEDALLAALRPAPILRVRKEG